MIFCDFCFVHGLHTLCNFIVFTKCVCCISINFISVPFKSYVKFPFFLPSSLFFFFPFFLLFFLSSSLFFFFSSFLPFFLSFFLFFFLSSFLPFFLSSFLILILLSFFCFLIFFSFLYWRCTSCPSGSNLRIFLSKWKFKFNSLFGR